MARKKRKRKIRKAGQKSQVITIPQNDETPEAKKTSGKSAKATFKDTITFRLKDKDSIRIYRNRDKALYDYVKDNFSELQREYKKIGIKITITKNYVEIQRIKKKRTIKVQSPDTLKDLGTEKPRKREIERNIKIKVEKNVETSISFKDQQFRYNQQKKYSQQENYSQSLKVEVSSDKFVFVSLNISHSQLIEISKNKDTLISVLTAYVPEIKMQIMKMHTNMQTVSGISLYSAVVSKSGNVYLSFVKTPHYSQEVLRNIQVNLNTIDNIVVVAPKKPQRKIDFIQAGKSISREIDAVIRKKRKLLHFKKKSKPAVNPQVNRKIQLKGSIVHQLSKMIKKITITSTIKLFLSYVEKSSKPRAEQKPPQQQPQPQQQQTTQQKEGFFDRLKNFFKKRFRF